MPLSSLTLPLRDGDMDKREDTVYRHAYYLNARSDIPPGIVDKNLNRITEKSGFYSGCYGRAPFTSMPSATMVKWASPAD